MALIAVCGCDGGGSRSPAIKIVSYAGIIDDVAHLYHSWQYDATVRRQHKKQDIGPMTSVSATPGREATRLLLLFLMRLSFFLSVFFSLLFDFPEASVFSQAFCLIIFSWFVFPVVGLLALELEQKDCRPRPHGVKGGFHDMGTAQA